MALEQELKIASDIQQQMLPKVYPPFPERTDIDIFGEVVTAKKVGGDLFDFFIRDDKALLQHRRRSRQGRAGSTGDGGDALDVPQCLVVEYLA